MTDLEYEHLGPIVAWRSCTKAGQLFLDGHKWWNNTTFNRDGHIYVDPCHNSSLLREAEKEGLTVSQL